MMDGLLHIIKKSLLGNFQDGKTIILCKMVQYLTMVFTIFICNGKHYSSQKDFYIFICLPVSEPFIPWEFNFKITYSKIEYLLEVC